MRFKNRFIFYFSWNQNSFPSVKIQTNPQICSAYFSARNYVRKSANTQNVCQIVYFQTKSTNLGNFWRVLQRKTLVNFIDIWSILQPFGIGCGHLVDMYCGNLVYCFPVWVCCAKKNLATLVWDKVLVGNFYALHTYQAWVASQQVHRRDLHTYVVVTSLLEEIGALYVCMYVVDSEIDSAQGIVTKNSHNLFT
jgi:hypothetical protein